MEKEIRLKHDIFGYNTIVKKGDQIITLKGDQITELDIGMEVVLLGDSRGYVPSNFEPGEKVTIVEFTEPFLNFHSDDIIKVKNGSLEGWVKPSNIQVTRYHSVIRSRADANHRRIKNKVGEEFANFMDLVYRSMTDKERSDLLPETMPYVNTIVSFALNRLRNFGDRLAYTVAKVYKADLFVRFIQDPVRSKDDTLAYLYLDKDGYLISVVNPEIVTSTSNPSFKYMKDYDFYIVLNGPFKGKQFNSSNRPLGEPIYKSDVALTFDDSFINESNNEKSQSVRVFISYAHTDEFYRKELEKHLSVLKRNGYIDTWTDREIMPGEHWGTKISNELEEAKIILLLISADFLASNYCYDIEMNRALERHNSQEAIVIPIIIRFCDWTNTPFAAIQGLPVNAKPVKDWSDQDQAFLNIVESIKVLLNSLQKGQQSISYGTVLNPQIRLSEIRKKLLSAANYTQLKEARFLLSEFKKNSTSSFEVEELEQLIARSLAYEEPKSTIPSNQYGILHHIKTRRDSISIIRLIVITTIIVTFLIIFIYRLLH